MLTAEVICVSFPFYWLISGMMLLRQRSKHFVDKWIEAIEKDEKAWDQAVFNNVLKW
jgi:hypothetical protein